MMIMMVEICTEIYVPHYITFYSVIVCAPSFLIVSAVAAATAAGNTSSL